MCPSIRVLLSFLSPLAPSIAQVARLDKELLLVRKSAAASSGSLRVGLERELLQRELRLEEERRGADEQTRRQTERMMLQVQTQAEQLGRQHAEQVAHTRQGQLVPVDGASRPVLEAAVAEHMAAAEAARDDAALARAHWGAAESRVAELRAVTEKQAATLEEALARVRHAQRAP